MENIEKKRIYSFDLLKIISIFIVFMHHIVMDMYVVHPMHNLKVLEDIIIRPNLNLPMLACGLFVLISGATLALKEKEEEPLEFYKKRFLRVLIPFYIAYIMYFIIKVYNNRSIFIFGGVPKWRFIFTILGIDEYLSANGIRTFSLSVGEWFLGCIILCYIVYPILYKMNKKYKIWTFVFMTIYFILINLNYNKLNFTIPSHMNFLCQIYNFYLGIFLIDKSVLSKIKKSMLFITIPIIIFFFTWDKMIFIPDNYKTTIVVVAAFITMYLFEEQISSQKILKVVIEFFNKISLEIFLAHHFIIYQVDYMLKYRRVNGVETLVIIAFDFIVTIIISIIVKKLSDKVYRFVDKCKNK